MKNKQINLAVPRTWNELTTKQLESIIPLYDKGFNENTFTCLAFLKLIDVKVLRRVVDEEKEFSTYLLRNRGFKPWITRECIPVRSWQIRSWANKFLGYLVKECTLLVSPYPEIKLRGVKYKGAADRLADVSWHQYKWAQDYLLMYREEVVHLNWLVDNNGSKTDVKKCLNQVKMFRNCFLSTLFTPEVEVVNSVTGKEEKKFVYQIGQTEANYLRFKKVTDTEFKVITLFWDGVQVYLQKNFTHLYKSGEKASKQNIDSLMNSIDTMAVIMDRLNKTSDQLYNENFFIILRVLEQISAEAEEMKKQMKEMKK